MWLLQRHSEFGNCEAYHEFRLDTIKKLWAKREKECIRNIKLQWLLEDIRPNYHSISDFRKDNFKGLKNSFKLFVSFLKDANLIRGKNIAFDVTKSKADHKKNSFKSK